MLGSKRGMSPLIATMLLIAFAVSIGAVIMSYGNAYYADDPLNDEGARKICESVRLEFYSIDREPQICRKSLQGKEFLSFILINKGSVDVDAIQLLASLRGDSSSVDIIPLERSSVSVGFPYEAEVAVNTSKGRFVQVQFIASVQVGSDTHKCFMEAVSTEGIRTC